MANELSTVSSRLNAFIGHLGISERSFAANVGLSSGYLSMTKKGKGISMEAALKILSKYPQLRMEWLMEGKGDMLSSDKKGYLVDLKPPNAVKEVSQPLYGKNSTEKEITVLKMKIHDLEIENKALKEALRQIGKGLNQ